MFSFFLRSSFRSRIFGTACRFIYNSVSAVEAGKDWAVLLVMSLLRLWLNDLIDGGELKEEKFSN